MNVILVDSKLTAIRRDTPEELVDRLGIEAAEAPEYAHALGVVHRDVKPA